MIVNMMKGVVQRGTARYALALGRPTAGKTGTSANYKDVWFNGFTTDLLVLGVDRPRRLDADRRQDHRRRRRGADLARLHAEGASAHARSATSRCRRTSAFARVEPWSGDPGGPSAHDAVWMPFVRGTLPAQLPRRPAGALVRRPRAGAAGAARRRRSARRCRLPVTRASDPRLAVTRRSRLLVAAVVVRCSRRLRCRIGLALRRADATAPIVRRDRRRAAVHRRRRPRRPHLIQTNDLRHAVHASAAATTARPTTAGKIDLQRRHDATRHLRRHDGNVASVIAEPHARRRRSSRAELPDDDARRRSPERPIPPRRCPPTTTSAPMPQDNGDALLLPEARRDHALDHGRRDEASSELRSISDLRQ